MFLGKHLCLLQVSVVNRFQDVGVRLQTFTPKVKVWELVENGHSMRPPFLLFSPKRFKGANRETDALVPTARDDPIVEFTAHSFEQHGIIDPRLRSPRANGGAQGRPPAVYPTVTHRA